MSHLICRYSEPRCLQGDLNYLRVTFNKRGSVYFEPPNLYFLYKKGCLERIGGLVWDWHICRISTLAVVYQKQALICGSLWIFLVFEYKYKHSDKICILFTIIYVYDIMRGKSEKIKLFSELFTNRFFENTFVSFEVRQTIP